MNHGCRGVAAERERKHVQHLDALGKRRVQIVGDGANSVFAEIARHEPKMVPGAIVADRHGIGKIENQKRQEEQPPRRRPRPLGNAPFRVRESDRDGAAEEKCHGIDKPEQAGGKYEQGSGLTRPRQTGRPCQRG